MLPSLGRRGCYSHPGKYFATLPTSRWCFGFVRAKGRTIELLNAMAESGHPPLCRSCGAARHPALGLPPANSPRSAPAPARRSCGAARHPALGLPPANSPISAPPHRRAGAEAVAAVPLPRSGRAASLSHCALVSSLASGEEERRSLGKKGEEYGERKRRKE
jgi:hypothetical protein